MKHESCVDERFYVQGSTYPMNVPHRGNPTLTPYEGPLISIAIRLRPSSSIDLIRGPRNPRGQSLDDFISNRTQEYSIIPLSDRFQCVSLRAVVASSKMRFVAVGAAVAVLAVSSVGAVYGKNFFFEKIQTDGEFDLNAVFFENVRVSSINSP